MLRIMMCHHLHRRMSIYNSKKNFLPIIALCLPKGKQRFFPLSAAATATARATAFAFFAIAVRANYVQLKHGFHLLSNRRLSMDWGRKIGEQRAPALQFYWLITFTSFSVVVVSGANLIISCPQHITIFSWFRE